MVGSALWIGAIHCHHQPARPSAQHARNLLHHVSTTCALGNEAGHPASLKSLDRDDARVNLILFVGTARMVGQIRDWVATGYAP